MPEQEPATNELAWHEEMNAWTVTTSTGKITVPADVYDTAIDGYLTSIGIERKTYKEYVKSVEEAWNKQIRAERQLRQNPDFWKDCPGVEVTSYDKNTPTS